jgi:hypothetical protein
MGETRVWFDKQHAVPAPSIASKHLPASRSTSALTKRMMPRPAVSDSTFLFGLPIRLLFRADGAPTLKIGHKQTSWAKITRRSNLWSSRGHP